MTDLTQAIAEIRRVTPLNSPWEVGDIGVGSSPVDYHIATILNAVTSGDLIPKADHKLAVAEAYRKAASVAANACLVYPDGGSPTEDERLVCEEAYRRILALADTDALAEVQALRAELAATQAKLADAVGALPEAFAFAKAFIAAGEAIWMEAKP